MKKKVLIWDVSFLLENVGGPAGYLYNIHEYLRSNSSDQITFLSDLLPIYIEERKQLKRGILSRIKNGMKRNRCIIELYTLYYFYFKAFKLPINLDLSIYDFIHFHTIFDLNKYYKYIRYFDGQIILTTHTPEPPYDEIINTFVKTKFFAQKVRNIFIKREISFIERSKPIWVFPCKYSLEPYIYSSFRYDKYFRENSETLYYIPTSILEEVKIETELNYFSKYGVPDDAFKIVYIGRHNSVKGYDELKLIAEEVLSQQRANIYFIIAGKEEPLKRLNHKQWIELGWINNADEVIANADLFILPNKQTYFDLILLEALRAGTTLLLSNTGGNKYFINDLPENETIGIYSYEKGQISQAVNKIMSLVETDTHTLGESNRKLWNKYFRVDSFVEKYIIFLNAKKN